VLPADRGNHYILTILRLLG